MIVLIVILLALAALYLLALMGRKGHPGLDKLQGWNYAHRGLHGSGVPENSMLAFRLARDKGYGVEFDIHLLKDGGLAVIHDSKLIRTTGREGYVEDLTVEDLKDYPLEGTEETIPQFHQVLELYAGKAPLIIELKAERGNHAALCAAVCDTLKDYKGEYCIESFDPRCLLWLKKHRPDIVRGQLAENFFKDGNAGLSWPLRFVLTNLLLNFLTRPDFVAYKYQDRGGLSPTLCDKLWHIQSVSWTLRKREELDTAVSENRLPIFEYFEP